MTLEMVTVTVGEVFVTVTISGALDVPASCLGNDGEKLSGVSSGVGLCCCGFGPDFRRWFCC
jgi:hypothetical protein